MSHNLAKMILNNLKKILSLLVKQVQGKAPLFRKPKFPIQNITISQRIWPSLIMTLLKVVREIGHAITYLPMNSPFR